MTIKPGKVLEWGVNIVLSLFHGYDDSGAVQNGTRIVNKTYYQFANRNIVHLTDNGASSQELTDVTLFHPAVRFLMALTRIGGIVIMTLSGIISQVKNQQELDQLEILADQEQMARNLDAINIKEMLDNQEYLRSILRNYRLNRRKVTAYDANKLAIALQELTHYDHAVLQSYNRFIVMDDDLSLDEVNARENHLIDEVMRSLNTKSRKSIHVRNSRKALNFFGCIFESFTTMTVTQGFAGVVVGIPVINLALTIVMICLAVTLGTLKFIKDFGIDKHNKRENKKRNQTLLRNERIAQLSALYDHTERLSLRPVNAMQQEYHPKQDKINAIIVEEPEPVNKSLFVGRAIAGSLTALGAGIVTGCFGVAMLDGMAIALGGTGFLVSATAATLIPIVGAVIACAYTLVKLAWNLYQSYQNEQQSNMELAQQKRAQLQRALYDEELRNTQAINSQVLLRKYVQNHLTLKSKGINEIEDKESFMRTIETVIGFKRPLSNPVYQDCYGKKIGAYEDDYAATEDDFYSYLASQMSSATAGEKSQVKLARQLKNYMHSDQVREQIPANDAINVDEIKRSKNFQPWRKKIDNPAENDHVGNLKRTLFAVPDAASIAFSLVCVISISCCLAMIFTFAAAPIVAGIAIAVLGGAFAINKALEYQTGKRLQSNVQQSAHMTMQDKTSHTHQQLSHTAKVSPSSYFNFGEDVDEQDSLDSAISIEEPSSSQESSYSQSKNRYNFINEMARDQSEAIDAIATLILVN